MTSAEAAQVEHTLCLPREEGQTVGLWVLRTLLCTQVTQFRSRFLKQRMLGVGP